ncbi:putative sodium-dependent multivitamin transporter [Orussus abietinus]|uniref:putative sodium-dependent multivitamin transporter n=1 Tax=Orussus abietinus TaxID=222816 RepID=UPI000626C04B|nr:putative sodium-dependent multivitamin transporter [Orussus abietinus]XP_012280970.1 putative sodium-dependent multivitamin transporter [Orussus abietinus]XP_012280971.1 putative sodium-dependent multivitamin transporter [Orussus abietinus]XP_012280972.1 putative sodium-dependent multivitamin transporter [Orussus abietinus]
MAETATLGWVDYLVIGVMLCISASIGIYYRFTGGRQKTVEEYFNADRSMSVLPVGIALVVSFMSAITILGVSAENYAFGTQFVVINIAYLVGIPIICYGFLPVFFKLQATSAYEYLEKRFGVGARLVASFAYWIQLFLYSGIVLYAPALALEATTGLSKNASILIVGLVCAFYSGIGGIKAVLMTDVFQGILMFLSVLVIIGTAAKTVGGLDQIWYIAEKGGRIEFDSYSIDPTVRHTWWSLLIGGLFTFLSLFGVNQVQIQRMMTVKSLKAARLTLWINWPILSLLSILTCFSGLAIYSKYYNCDPLTQGRISSIDQLMPLYVVDTMSHLPGLPGLFIAGIFSAGLSTLSAGLNSLAAVTIEDYFKPVYEKFAGKEFPPLKLTLLGKVFAFVFGLSCIALAFLAQYLGDILQVSLTIFGVVGGPLLGIFTLGMGFESAGQSGAITGLMTSLAFLLWIAFGTPRPTNELLPLSVAGCEINDANSTLSTPTLSPTDNESYFYLYRISYMWYAPLGFLITIIVGLVVSNLVYLCSGRERVECDPDLFFPFVSTRLRRKLRLNTESNGHQIPSIVLQRKYTFDDDHDVSQRDQVASTVV